MRTMTTAVVVFMLALTISITSMVWEGRGATLETALTREDVVSSCVLGTWGEKYTLAQLFPCLRAGFLVSAQRRQVFRTALALAEVEKGFAKIDETRKRLEELANPRVPKSREGDI